MMCGNVGLMSNDTILKSRQINDKDNGIQFEYVLETRIYHQLRQIKEKYGKLSNFE